MRVRDMPSKREHCHRPAAPNVQHWQNDHSHGRPLRPPLPPVENPDRQPDAAGCEGDGQGWKDDPHGGIVPTVAIGGKIDRYPSRQVTGIHYPILQR
jgi:hypothetical protein